MYEPDLKIPHQPIATTAESVRANAPQDPIVDIDSCITSRKEDMERLVDTPEVRERCIPH